MKISFHPLVLPVVLSRPMSGWNFPPASVTGFSTVFAPPSDPDLFFPHSIQGPSQKDNQPVSRHFPPTTLFPGRCTQRNAWYHKGLRSFYRLVLSNFRRNALYACITPGRNEALCLFCSESFYMSPQGFRSATWSPTIPLRKIAFCLSVPQISAARIAGSVSELRIDKLLSRASRHPTVSQLELVCAPQQLFLRKRYTVALGERQYNLVIGPARRFVVPD